MFFQTNDLIHMFVGKSTNPVAGTQVNDPSAAGYIEDGQILVVGQDGYTVDTTPTYTEHKKIKLVQRFNNSLYFTPFITGVDITNWKGLKYAADTFRTECIGFNGTSGSFDITTPTEHFIFKITSEFEDTMYRTRDYTRTYVYKADTPTKIGLASAILKQGSKDWVMGSGKVIYEMLVNDAGVDTTFTTTVTKGSARVVFSGAHGLVVGDVFRPLSGTATTACYVVKTVISTTVLDMTSAYTGTSGTGNASEKVTVGANEVGIRVTAFDTDEFSPDLSSSRLNNFSISLVNFGTSTRTVSTLSKRGSGAYRRVAELEHQHVANDGATNYSTFPLDTARKFAASGTNYDIMWFPFSGKSDPSLIQAQTPRDQAVLIAMPSLGAAKTALLASLNSYMTSLPTAQATVVIA